MDANLKKIVSKSAGTYFIVTDNRDATSVDAESKLRLIFINVENGPVNVMVKFAKGATTSFKSTFGKVSRIQEKKGNFSVQTCLDALTSGPIAVVNLRSFDPSVDLASAIGMTVNGKDSETIDIPYADLFNSNGFWTPKPKNIVDRLSQGSYLLNFGNVDITDKSIVVVKAEDSDVELLTAQGDLSLLNTDIEFDEYASLDFANTLVKDLFVTVYIFNNDFSVGSATTNKYYGDYFDEAGNLDLSLIGDFNDIDETGFVSKVTGCIIPNITSESDVEISLDTIMNNDYLTDGIVCNINDDLLEATTNIIDLVGSECHVDGVKVETLGDYLMSYVIPATLTTSSVVFPPTVVAEDVKPLATNTIVFDTEKVTESSFIGSFNQGIRVGDKFDGVNGIVEVTALSILDESVAIAESTDTYSRMLVTLDNNVVYTDITEEQVIDEVPTTVVIGVKVTKLNMFTDTALVKPSTLTAYKPRIAQFCTGSVTNQSEILDMMNNDGIVRGVAGVAGIRYVVDAFKSFVDPDYKSQYGQFVKSLDEKNVFTRAIINEPFLEDLEESINPLFKTLPTGALDLSYLATGGNKSYSTKFLSKFSSGAPYCFFFGPGDVNRSVTKPLAGLISNVFYEKDFVFDVAANSSGSVDGVNELEYQFDDEERAYLESFCYNPVIYISGDATIFGNRSGNATLMPSIMQIHNSELLAYVKESLYNLSKSEAFKKGTYDDYLRSETETKSFMESLVTAGAIKSDFVVQCDSDNNTTEVSNALIKLIHVEYTAINSLEKVVFDLTLD